MPRAFRLMFELRLPANQVLQSTIGYLLTRPVGRPPHHVGRFHAKFQLSGRNLDQAAEGYPLRSSGIRANCNRVGFIVTNMSRPAERVVAFYNKRGTCEQWRAKARSSGRQMFQEILRLIA